VQERGQTVSTPGAAVARGTVVKAILQLTQMSPMMEDK